MERGKPGVGFFLIADGSATVSVDGKTIEVLKAGDHFGEVALIDEGPRRRGHSGRRTDLPHAGGVAVPSLRPGSPRVAWALLQSLVQRLVRSPGGRGQI
jgi:hypothetical protein